MLLELLIVVSFFVDLRERETNIDLLLHPFMHSQAGRVLTVDRTCNLGALRQCSNQLNPLARTLMV